MARSTNGLDKSNLDAFYQHMRRAVAYTTTQATGVVMRTTPGYKPRRDPATKPRITPHQPDLEASVQIDTAYLALHPYTP